MTMPERGAYITLLCLCWLEHTLPADLVALARLCNVPLSTFTRWWPALEPCFTISDGRLVQPRIERERQKQETYRALKVEAGKQGGRPNADGKQNQSRSQANESPPSSSSSSVSDLRSSEEHVQSERRLEPDPDENPLLRRAGALLERYAELFYEHRRGARYHNRMHLDFPKAQELVKTWADDARLEKLAVIILTTDDEWIAGTDRGFGIFAARASWADDRLTIWEAEHAQATHP